MTDFKIPKEHKIVIQYCNEWQSRVTQCLQRTCPWDTGCFCVTPCSRLAKNTFCLQNAKRFGFVIEFWKCVCNIVECKTIFGISLDKFQTHYRGSGQWLHVLMKDILKSMPLVKSRQSSTLELILIESFAFNTVSKWEHISSNLILIFLDFFFLDAFSSCSKK